MTPPSSSRARQPSGRRRRGAVDDRSRRAEQAQAEALASSRQVLAEVAARRDEAWRRAAESARRRALTVLAAPFGLGLLLLLLGLVALPLLAVGGVLLVLWAAVAFWAWRAATSGPAHRLGGISVAEAVAAGLLPEVAAERYRDVAQSLCDALGLELPGLYVLVDPAVNSIASGHGSSARLYLTTGLLSVLERIELEGVVAHELSHLKRLDTLTAGLSVVLLRGGRLPLPGARAAAAYLEGEDRELAADLAAVQVTRYPPGLSQALAQAGAPAEAAPAAAVRPAVLAETASQWLVTPRDDLRLGAFGPAERLAVLEEL